MSKIRINELARQLEVKSREVIDKLHELGITEPLTHSSSIDDDNAEKLRRYFGGDTSAIVAPPRKESVAPPRREQTRPAQTGRTSAPAWNQNHHPSSDGAEPPSVGERRPDLQKHSAAGASSAPSAAAHDSDGKTAPAPDDQKPATKEDSASTTSPARFRCALPYLGAEPLSIPRWGRGRRFAGRSASGQAYR